MSNRTDEGDDSVPDRSETVELLARREQLLAALIEQPRDKRSLTDCCAFSRSTVDRAIRELEARGLVTRRDGSYAVTQTGRLLYQSYCEFTDRTAALSDAQELLDCLPCDLELPTAVIVDADVEYRQPPTPYRPVLTWLEQLDGAVRVRGLVRSISYAETPGTFAEHVLDGMEYEPVYEETVAAFLAEDHDGERDRMVESGRYHPYEVESVPFAMHLIEYEDDAVVSIGCYDDAGLVGILTNDRPEAISWAESYYESFRADATPIEDRFRSD